MGILATARGTVRDIYKTASLKKLYPDCYRAEAKKLESNTHPILMKTTLKRFIISRKKKMDMQRFNHIVNSNLLSLTLFHNCLLEKNFFFFLN